jgi:hypothetical protein
MVWIVLQNNNLYKLVTLHVRFQVLTAASLKMTAFWDVAPCSVVEVGRRFRDAYCLHHEGDGYSYLSIHTRRL